jgi:hypothetical protein
MRTRAAFAPLFLPVVAAAACVLVAGCTHPKRWFSNRSLVRDTVVALPGDGAIHVEVEQTDGLGRTTQYQRSYVWDQPGRERKVLKVSGAGDDSFASVDPAACTARVSDDGNVAELLAAGRVIATFDYAAGTVTFVP